MPTATSWIDPRALRRAMADLGHLLRFRAATSRVHGRARLVVAILLLVTAAASVVPAVVSGAGAGRSDRAFEVLLVLPSAYAGFLALATLSAIASGGGRELLPREAAVAFPVSPTTDHLGALLLAPLNIAWLLQAWALLGATAYAVGPAALPVALPVTFGWLLVATAWAQVVAWSVEAVRRRPHGPALVRTLGVVIAGSAVVLVATGTVGRVLDALPTRSLAVALVSGASLTWVQVLLVELGLLLVGVFLGAWPTHRAARRLPRDEARMESEAFRARPMPGSDLTALLRLDRGSVWRAVPMRRGLAVLSLGPGAVALAGDLPWDALTILPGLVAAGGALLFGVNAWCLDARGALWRENLPVRAGTVFTARAIVLTEFLGLASLVTVVLASLRAGVPSPAEATALACTLLVVTVQVVALALQWSVRHPYAVDLRSARATPAPPMTMLGYSARLAVGTTLTGLLFSVLAGLSAWQLPVVAAVPFLLFALRRLVRARAVWVDPAGRARVVAVVSA